MVKISNKNINNKKKRIIYKIVPLFTSRYFFQDIFSDLTSHLHRNFTWVFLILKNFLKIFASISIVLLLRLLEKTNFFLINKKKLKKVEKDTIEIIENAQEALVSEDINKEILMKIGIITKKFLT